MRPTMNIARTGVAVLLSLTALSACATVKTRLGLAQDPQTVSTAGMPGAIEPIHAAALLNNVAVFWVSSNGCTARDDLRPMVST